MTSGKLGSLLICLLAYLLIGLFAHARAQEVRTITIVPPTVEKTLNPGGKAEGVMKVINDSTEPISFTASVNDFVVDDTLGTPNLLPPNTLSKKFSASTWIGITPATFTILPHQKQDLNYFIQIPADARPGGHYAAAIYTPIVGDDIQGTGAKVETKLGTLFYISVNGQITESSLISRFFTNAFQEYGPVAISTQVKNLGDLHIKPSGFIKVTDMFGRSIQSQNLSEHNIFPGAARDYENTFGQKLMIGRFKASLLASYGRDSNRPLIASVYFWVFPWKLASLAMLIIVAIILGVMFLKKKNKKPKAEEKVTPVDPQS